MVAKKYYWEVESYFDKLCVTMSNKKIVVIGLSEEMPLKQAIEFAKKAAAFSVKKLGAQTSSPQREEVDPF